MRRPVKVMNSVAVALFVFLPLMACGGGSSHKDGSPAPVPTAPSATPGDPAFIDEAQPAAVDLQSHMIFDRHVSATAKESLKRDFTRIERFDLTTGSAHDRTLQDLLQIKDLSGSSLSTWLKERVRYILSPDLSQYRVGTVLAEFRSYEVERLPGSDPEETRGMAAAMTGAALYQAAKQMRRENPGVNYLMIEVNNSWIHLNHQRNGVMQIGPALFDPKFMPNNIQDSYANTAVRVETLFHEARHADGNSVGLSLGFYHTLCPEGAAVAKEYVNKPACDSNANGPYTVGAKILKSYIEKCGNLCSIKDKTVLEAFMLDSLSRVVKRNDGQLPVLDPRPEKGFEKVDISNFSLILAQ
jgi:hypothetical protein